MTEAEAFFVLKNTFKDQNIFGKVVSRFIRHNAVWKKLQDDDFLKRVINEIGSDENNWTISNICRIAAGDDAGNSGTDFENNDETGGESKNSALLEVLGYTNATISIDQFYAIAKRIKEELERESEQFLSENDSEISRESILSGWGTIFSIAIEGMQTKEKIFSFIVNKCSSGLLAVWSFVLAANPEIAAEFKGVLSEHSNSFTLENLISLLKEIHLWGNHEISTQIAAVYLKKNPSENLFSDRESSASIKQDFEQINQLKNYGLLYKFLADFDTNKKVFNQIKIEINALEQKIQNLLIPVLQDSNIDISALPGDVKSEKGSILPSSLVQKVQFARDIGETDRDAAFLLARDIAVELDREEKILPLISHPEGGFNIQPISLVAFLRDFNWVLSAKACVEKLLREIPMDPDLIRSAGRFDHDYGDHVSAIKQFTKTLVCSELTREEKKMFAESLEYCGRWTEAVALRVDLNFTGLEDIAACAQGLVMADKLDLYQEVIERDHFGFKGSDFDRTIHAWIDNQNGLIGAAQSEFEKLAGVPIKDFRAALMVAEYFENKNDHETALKALASYSGKTPAPSIILKQIQIESSLGNLPEIDQRCQTLTSMISAMEMREFEDFLQVLIDREEFVLAGKIVNQMSDQWILSSRLSALRGKILLENNAFHQAESILSRAASEGEAPLDMIVDLCLSILNCSRKKFPLKMDRSRLHEIGGILSKLGPGPFGNLFLELISAEMDDASKVAKYQDIKASLPKELLHETWRIYCGIGMHHFMKSGFDQAVIHFLEAVPYAGENRPEIYLFIIRSFIHIQMWQEAVNLIDSLIKESNLPFDFYWKIHLYLSTYNDWGNHIQENYLRNPEIKAIRFLHAASLLTQGQQDPGIRLMEELIIEDAEDIGRQLVYAQILMDAGELTRAGRIIEIILSNRFDLTPEDLLSIAFLYHQIGEPHKVIGIVNQVKIQNKWLTAYSALLEKEEGNLEEAASAMDGYLNSTQAEHSEINLDKIWVHKPELWRMIERQPAAVYLIGSQIAGLTNDQEKSMQLLELGLRAFPGQVSLLMASVEKAHHMGILDTRQKYTGKLDSYMAEKPEKAGLCLLGEIALAAGKEILAAEYLSRALEIDESYPRTMALQARVLLRNGNKPEAEQLLKKIKTQVDISDGKATQIESDKKAGNIPGSWLARAAYEIGDYRLCLDICHLYGSGNGMIHECASLYLSALGMSLIINDVYESFKVKEHLIPIDDMDKKFFDDVRSWVETMDPENNRWDDWILINHILFTGDMDGFNKIVDLDLPTEACSLKIKAEFFINGLERAEIILRSLLNNRLAVLTCSGLVVEKDPSKALAWLKTLTNNHPPDPVLLAALAVALKQGNQLQDAYAAIQLALDSWPEEYGWEMFAADISQEIGDLHAAMDHYERANQIHPDLDTEDTILKLYLPSHNPRAIPMLEERLKKSPSDIDCLMKLAEICKCNQQLRKTVFYLEQVLQAKADHVPAIVMLAEIALKLRKFSKAEEHIRHALRLEPQHTPAFLIRCEIILAQQGVEQAVFFLDECIENSVGSRQELIIKKIDLLDQNIGPSAALNYIISLEGNDMSAEVLARKAQLYLHEKNVERAISTANQVLAKGQNSKAITILGDAAELNGELDRAVDFYIKALRIDPLDRKIYIKLSKIYEARREYNQSKDILMKGLKHYPQDFDLLLQAAHHHYRRNMRDQAIEAIQKALKIQPNNQDAVDLLALLHTERGTQI